MSDNVEIIDVAPPTWTWTADVLVTVLEGNPTNEHAQAEIRRMGKLLDEAQAEIRRMNEGGDV